MTAAADVQPHREIALGRILAELTRRGYVFVTPSPSTHTLVRDRMDATAEDALRDIFGWCRPFPREHLDPELFALVEAAGVVRREHAAYRLTIRASTIDGRLYLHSAPSRASDAVFLGPDSYR